MVIVVVSSHVVVAGLVPVVVWTSVVRIGCVGGIGGVGGVCWVRRVAGCCV